MDQSQKDTCKEGEYENDSYMKMFIEEMGACFLYKKDFISASKIQFSLLKRNLTFFCIFRILLWGHKIRRDA